MNRALIIGILGGVIVVAAVLLTFFIDRPPDGADKAKSTPPVVQPAAPKASTEAPKPAAEVAEADPKEATPETAKEAVKPSFDVVRVNPRGDTVIAGRAEPHAEVTIKDGEKVIGKVTADARGEWVQVPEKALPPGTRELSLSAKSPEVKEPVKSDNKVVLVVPKRGEDIAGRETPGESGALVIAVPRDGSPGVKVLQTPGIQAEAKPDPETEQASTKTRAKTAPQDTETVVAAAPTAPKTQGTEANGAPAPSAAKSTREEPTAPAAAATLATPTPKAPGAEAVVAAAPEAPKETQQESAAPSAAAPSVKEPSGEIVVATAPDKSGARGLRAASDDRQTGSTRELASASNGADAQKDPGIAVRELTLDAIDYDDTGRLAVTGRARAGANVQVYLDNKPLGAASADKSGRWQLEPGEKVQPGLYRMRVDQVDSKGRVLARIETPFSRAEPLGDLPRDSIVFVQPGNSLWRIARRTYGEGLRYSVIYEANREQIRNPDLIYPGQVFHLPRVN